MPAELETLVRHWFDEVWNNGNASAIEEMLSNETVHHGVSGFGDETVRGVEGFKALHDQLMSAIPDLHFDIHEVMTDDERIAIRYTLTGTHTGHGLPIPATNRRIKIAGGGIGRARDGKFTEVFNLLDFFTMYSQLGAFPHVDHQNESETVVRRWFEEVWNGQRESAIDELFAEDGLAYGLSADGSPVRGPADFKVFHRNFVQAFPDINVKIENMVVAGDKASVSFRVTGTHGGDGVRVSPTNESVNFTGMVTVRVQDGKIVEAWNEVDFMKMYTQLGALTLNLQ